MQSFICVPLDTRWVQVGVECDGDVLYFDLNITMQESYWSVAIVTDLKEKFETIIAEHDKYITTNVMVEDRVYKVSLSKDDIKIYISVRG